VHVDHIAEPVVHAEIFKRRERIRKTERGKIGRINHQLEAERLKLRRVELDYGIQSYEYERAEDIYEARITALNAEYASLEEDANLIKEEDAKYEITLADVNGREKTLLLSDIVRLYAPNTLNPFQKAGIYISRWIEFLTAEPREANTEGGVMPAIFGTFAMTILMAFAVAPFGVLASLYLREYAKQGRLVSIVRICVNNLAGVPSIVYGVFGLGLTGQAGAPAATGQAGERVESGSLGPGDGTLDSGEYVDEFTFSGRNGETLVLDLRSGDFDPYLIVLTPSGEGFENDDHEGDPTRSLISLDMTEAGEYTIGVTSYAAGETGSYTLRIRQTSSAQTAARSSTERGQLAAGDETLSAGEYADPFTFEGRPGQRARLDLYSSEFDTYLILAGPGEFRFENDDVDGAPGHSIIEADLTEAGTYHVIVTSYAPAETGAYELSLTFGESSQSESDQRDVRPISVGETLSGRLEAGDAQLPEGEYRDLFVFDGASGQDIQVEITSSDFDTYLGVILPSGEAIENDDFEGSTGRSLVELTLRESGRYRIVATSYAAEETGSYQVRLASGTSGSGPAPAPTGQGQVYGVFVGISDYPGEANDLSYTAEDAHRVADALARGSGMPAANSIILTDSQASGSNVRDAISRMGNMVGPNDVFVFFYSGHGNRLERSGFQQTDPDALDETIELYDGPIRDDEMSDLMAEINGRMSLIILDSCFSGGFSKDVISAPGRMGLFSSEEDVTSSVAAKFRAGGFLAQFLADAVGEKLADADGDRHISALELSQYLHERYRADVKAAGPADYVRTGGPQMGYQHLVVDRGSIGPYDIIFP